jgi:hypothetical protein
MSKYWAGWIGSAGEPITSRNQYGASEVRDSTSLTMPHRSDALMCLAASTRKPRTPSSYRSTR